MSLIYNYDKNGNIIAIRNGSKTISYVYDSQNQLIRENNQERNYTYTWTYDNAGNIRTRNEYPYTIGSLGSPKKTVSYQYRSAVWGDLLTQYNGKTISYDGVGNPVNDGTWTYTWKHGRELVSMSDGTNTWNYTYNADGLRTKRTNGTDTYTYVYSGSLLAMMTVGNDTLYFTYDASGVPLAVKYNGTTYYYKTNLQGDVIGIVDSSGTAVVTYAYDAWGVLLACTGTMAETLGTVNPLTYRGYVYDHETRLYYLQSRYYNPEWGRFINADIFYSTGQGFVGNNMFAYCLNNPVNRVDPTGNFPWWIIPIVIIPLLTGCSKKDGPPSDYVQDDSTDQNCYSYSFGLPTAANPGDYSVTAETPDKMYDTKSVYTKEEISDYVMRDMQAMNKSVRIVDSPADRAENEYIVAMKTSTYIIPILGKADYHFAVLLSDGTWADKPGQTPSRWNEIDGTALKWDFANVKGYYNTITVYFAVEK